MSRQITHILRLSETLMAFEGITHWTMSFRLFGKGDKLFRLMEKNADLSTRSAERAMERLDESWPDDLEWPSDIPRPSSPIGKAARHG
jgi:hypothetical protein